jgi:hypothetical protein
MKHAALRLLSLILGHKIINFLKNKLIFKQSKNEIFFERIIKINENNLTINDTLTGVPTNATIERAPRSSKRHVASADSWHNQDACLNSGISFSEHRKKENETFFSTTTYLLTNQTNT